MVVQPIKNKTQVRAIMDYLKDTNKRNAIMFGIGVYCGLRISDILALKVKDVRNKKNIKIRQKKTKKIYEFALNKELNELIQEYVKDKKDYEYLIDNQNNFGMPITRMQAHRILVSIKEKFRLKNFASHSLRKTFAYTLYKASNKDLTIVQDILGHSSQMETIRYIGLDREVKLNAMLKVTY